MVHLVVLVYLVSRIFSVAFSFSHSAFPSLPGPTLRHAWLVRWSWGVEGGRKTKAVMGSGASAPEVEGFQPVEGDRGRSRRRVWMVGIVVEVVLLSACVAIPAEVVGSWFVEGTIEAGRGAATPAVAVQDFFQDTPLGGALAGDEVEVNLLCDGREEQLHGRVVELVAAAKRAEVEGKVAFDRVEEHPSAGREQITGDRATYSTRAQWAYANTDPGRRPGRGCGGTAIFSRGRSS